MSLPLTEKQSFKASKTDSYCVLSDPAYREKYRERLVEARKKGMDMVIYPDGMIVFIENKISMYPYKWHRKKRDFERTKLVNRSSNRGNQRLASSSGLSADLIEAAEGKQASHKSEEEFAD